MSKTRANNEGNIKQRADGRFEVRVTVDYDKMTGKPKRVSKYAKTREEAVKLLNQMSFMNDTSPKGFTRVTLGDWLDLWLGKTDRALDGLAQARQEGAARRRQELEQVRAGLLEMKKEWEAWQR